MQSFTTLATFVVGLLAPLSLAGGGSSFMDCGGSSGIAVRINFLSVRKLRNSD